MVVVGGGISGLAAAEFLRRDAPPATRVTILEAADRVGGKLRVSELAGVPLDECAESLLLRRSEGVGLAAAAGLELAPAVTTSASLWTRGRLRPLPPRTVMGVPTDLRALAASRLLRPGELARVMADGWLPRARLGDDVSVGRHVAARLGTGVLDRLVEPLLGGIYAGRAEDLSMAATLPQLWPYVRRERSLLAADRACRRATGLPGGGGPPGEPGNAPVEGAVFGAPPGGLGRLPEAVATLSRATVRTGVTVRALRRTSTGWQIVTGPASDPEVIAADAVVLAVPPAPAARLLSDEVPGAAVELGRVRTASMAVVSLAFPAKAVPAVTGSGFLVPPVEARTVKAVTFSSAKWSSVAAAAPGLALLRASVGRLGEEAVLQRDDRELAGLAVADLTDALGITAAPVDVRVTRWGGGLPQYDVGHRDRVARIRAAVAGVAGLAVCGATYDGVGVPACIATAESAVADLLRQWRGD